jgi:hypothetical protein
VGTSIDGAWMPSIATSAASRATIGSTTSAASGGLDAREAAALG